VLASCGATGSGGAVSPTPSSRSVAFTEVATTAQAHDDSGPTVIVGTSDASRAAIARLVPGASASAGRVMVAAFQGQQYTGGYSVHITAIERRGDQLVVRATFARPGPGAIVTQVLAAPAHVVSIAAADATGLREAVLLDESGTEVARVTIT
jgi:PrcB C-terminal